ncbi:MAG: hypothetical protein ACSHYB_00345 [Roseibacillus sp.]
MTALRFLALLLFFTFPLAAQTSGDDQPDETQNATDEEDLKRFWQLALPDGHFMVALDRIASISRSSYVLDGGLIVTEVTIDTVGNALCRIYQITPASENSKSSAAQRATQRARELTGRAEELTGSNISSMVQKSYPTTTHAKTVEYRVQERSTLDALYGSLNKAWREGKGRRFSIAE